MSFNTFYKSNPASWSRGGLVLSSGAVGRRFKSWGRSNWAQCLPMAGPPRQTFSSNKAMLPRRNDEENWPRQLVTRFWHNAGEYDERFDLI